MAPAPYTKRAVAKARTEATRAAREAKRVLLVAKAGGHFEGALNAEELRKRAEDILAGQFPVEVRLSQGRATVRSMAYYTDSHGRTHRRADTDLWFTLRVYPIRGGARQDVFDFEVVHETATEPASTWNDWSSYADE